MAFRGRRPKLRVVKDGETVPLSMDDPGQGLDPNFDNELKPPSKFKYKRERELWDTFIRRMPWLTHFDTPRAYMWCVAWAKYEKDPHEANAHMLNQLRTLGSELGMDPASRTRVKNPGGSGGGKKDPADKYFDS